MKIKTGMKNEKKMLEKSGFALIVLLAVFQILFLPTGILSKTFAIETVVPEVSVISDDMEISLEPFVKIINNEMTKLGFPDLPDNQAPEVKMDLSEPIKVNYDDKNIKNVEGYVIDYDADVNEMIPLERTDVNEFKFPDSLTEGPKTLEIRLLLDNDQKISYTVLAMLER